MNAKGIRAELLALQAKAPRGVLRVESVHAWAKRHPNSAIHRAIEWDEPTAAKEYQLNQIRLLLRVYVVTEDGEPEMVSLSIDRATGGGYRRVVDVLRSATLTSVLLEDALAELERMRVKYHRVKELASVWSAADLVRAQASRKKKAAKRSTA